jgi:hypothetical protein
MAGFSGWFDGNWFNLIQTAGVIGTMLFAGLGLHREAKARETENLLTLAEHHRDLWSKISGNTDLERIFKSDADVEQNPPTIAESEFLNLVFVHFETGWSVANAGGITTLRDMQLDVRGFFSLPLPRAVWDETKGFRNPRFVTFVERALKRITSPQVEQVCVRK